MVRGTVRVEDRETRMSSPLPFFLGRTDEEQRMKEIVRKQKEDVPRVLGDREKEMMYLHVLATSPSHQGQGHGGKLLGAMNAMVYSPSSDPLNEFIDL